MTIEHKLTIKIEPDYSGDTRMDFEYWKDNKQYLVFGNASRYISGIFDHPMESLEDLREEYPDSLIFPLSAYIHSGTRFYIGEKTDQFDSGQFGWIVVTKDHQKELSIANTPEVIEEYLDYEMQVLTCIWEGDYITVSLYDADADEDVETFSGMSIDENHLVQDARDYAKSYLESKYPLFRDIIKELTKDDFTDTIPVIYEY